MRRAKAAANLIAVGVLLVCLVPPAGAQAQPAKGTASKPAASATKSAKSGKPAKGAVKTKTPKAAKPVEATTKSEAPVSVSHRDPFEPLVGKKTEGGMPINLPPGKAGLLIATTNVDGLVRSPNGMIAVVSNPQKRVYFIREGDRLYDGQVEKIGLDGVVFRQTGKDAFGKPVEHVVTKRIYSSAGEQQ
jgi:hypothetical protein